MPDVLHIVVIFHDLDELFHQLDVLLALQSLVVLGNHFDLGGGEGVLVHGLSNGVEIVRHGVDGEHIAIGLEIIGTGIHGIHHDLVFLVIAIFVVDHQNTLLVEAPGNAAGSTQVAAVLIEVVAHGASGAGGGDNYETITYEGYGPGGVAVIVETMTDNRNRTAGSMRHHFDKYGGNLGASGCVSWSFDKKGVLVIDNEDGDYEEDEVMMDAMDAGADDFEAEEDCFTIYTDPDDFNAVADALSKYTFASAQIEMVPQNYQKLESEEHIKLMEKLIEIMEDDDDVQNIWHNWEQE